MSMPPAVLRCFQSLSCLLLMLSTVLICALTPVAFGEETTNHQINEIKTAFILNIARFVRWPAEAIPADNTDFHLCLYRTNGLGEKIKSLKGQRIAGRSVNVYEIGAIVGRQGCDVLVIPDSEVDNFVEDLLPESTFNPTLTILDLTALDRGGRAYPGIMVSLVRTGAKINFEINLEEVHSAGLEMSSELLKLATFVKGDN